MTRYLMSEAEARHANREPAMLRDQYWRLHWKLDALDRQRTELERRDTSATVRTMQAAVEGELSKTTRALDEVRLAWAE